MDVEERKFIFIKKAETKIKSEQAIQGDKKTPGNFMLSGCTLAEQYIG